MRDALRLALSGGPGFAQIAITNVCNARCDFCSFAVGKVPKKTWQFASLEGVKDAIDILRAKDIRFITFTGGEPFIHPDLFAMMEHASRRDVNPVVVTNGSLLTDETIDELARIGTQNVIISIDSADPKVHERNRGLPGICDKIARANARLGALGIARTASVTVSKLVGDYAALPRMLKSLGFDNLTFSYPLTPLHSTYLSYSSSDLVSYSDEELKDRFRAIQALKRTEARKHAFPIMNPTESLNEMVRFVDKETSRYPCLAGHKYFFVDWKLDVYRCHYFPKPLCSIYDFPKQKPIRDHCDICMIDCYRDPSILQFVAVAFADAIELLRRGRPVRAFRTLFNRRTLDSLRAVAEGARWLLAWRRRKRPQDLRKLASAGAPLLPIEGASTPPTRLPVEGAPGVVGAAPAAPSHSHRRSFVEAHTPS